MTALYLSLMALAPYFAVGLGFMWDLRRWRREHNFEWLARAPLTSTYFLWIWGLWARYALSMLHKRWHGWYPAWAADGWSVSS